MSEAEVLERYTSFEREVQHLTVLPQHYRLKCGACGHVVTVTKRKKQ